MEINLAKIFINCDVDSDAGSRGNIGSANGAQGVSASASPPRCKWLEAQLRPRQAGGQDALPRQIMLQVPPPPSLLSPAARTAGYVASALIKVNKQTCE